MANTLLVKRSAVAGNVPSTSALALGELAVNTYDGKLFFKKNDGAESVVKVSNEGHTHTIEDVAGVAPALEGEPNGFPDPSQVTMTFNEGTRTLTVTPAGASFEFYSNGTLFTKTAPQSTVIPDTEGVVLAYFNAAGALTSQVGFTPEAIAQNCLVASCYWDATNKTAIPNAWCELHGSSMSPATHAYLHKALGVQWVSGISLEVTTDDSTDAGNQIASSAGVTADEDLALSILAQAKGATIPVLYKSGAAGVWRADKTRLYPFLNTGTGRVAWNEFTGGAWQLTEVSNGYYTLAHIYAIPGLNQNDGRLIAIPGENQYQRKSDAQDAALYEALQLDMGGLPGPEFLLVGTLIIETRDNYGTQKARFSPTLDGKTYIDWRGNKSASSAGATTTASWGSITGSIEDQTDLIDRIGGVATSIAIHLPFYKADSTLDTIQLASNTFLPFFTSSGVSSPINLVVP
jgi:hypothetical protein